MSRISIKDDQELSGVERQAIISTFPFKIKKSDNVIEEKHEVKVEKTSIINCLVFVPTKEKIKKKKINRTIFYIPGTAAAAIPIPQERAICSQLADQLDCRIICVLHRLSEQNQFPIPPNDVIRVINAYMDAEDEFRLDLSNIFLAGYSFGCLMAIQICMESLRRNKTTPFRQIILLAPMTNLIDDPKRNYSRDAEFVKMEFPLVVKRYVPKNENPALPILSPTENLFEAFRGFPPTIIVYGENDSLCQDIKEFCYLLEQQKVIVKSILLPDRNHCFPWLETEYIAQVKVKMKEIMSFAVSLKKGPKTLLPIFESLHLMQWGKIPLFNNDVFVERLEITSKLRERFKFEVKQGEPAALSTLCGMGGMGKTQYALFYFFKYGQRYQFCWWFYVGPENLSKSDGKFFYSSLNEQYKQLAFDIGLVNKDSKIEECVVQIKKRLEGCCNWLIVFDDIDDEKLLQSYLPRCGGHILITSRNRQWQHPIPVDLMQVDEAIELSRKILKDREGNEQIRLLILKLERFPLAVAQASAYIAKDITMSISKYLVRYDTSKEQLLRSNIIPSQTEYHRSVWVTLDLSIDKIEKIDPSGSAIKLLYACAYLSPQNIPSEFLELLLGQSYSGAINILWDYMFVTVRRINEKDSFISIHPLVQEVLRTRCLRANKEFSILNDLLKMIGELPRSYLKSIYLNHIEQILRYVDGYPDKMKKSFANETLSRVYANLACIQYDMCFSEPALANAKKAIMWSESKEVPLLTKIAANNALTLAYWLSGDIKQGISHATQTLELAKQASDLFEEAKLSHNLATQHHRYGNLQKAADLLKRAISIYELKLKELDLSVALKKQFLNLQAKAYVILGFVYNDMQNAQIKIKGTDDAVRFAQSAQLIWEKLKSEYPNDKDLAESCDDDLSLVNNCLGLAFLAKGDKARALQYLKKSLQKREEVAVQHKSHPRLVAQCMVEISGACLTLAESLSWLIKAFEKFFQIFPKNNIYIADGYRVTGKILAEYGEWNAAEKFLRSYLEIVDQELPSDHFKIKITSQCLARCCSKQNILLGSKPSAEMNRHEVILLLNSYLRNLDCSQKKVLSRVQRICFYSVKSTAQPAQRDSSFASSQLSL